MDNLNDIRAELERKQNELLQSSSKDEALAIALAAAELSMKALKLSKDSDARKFYSAKVQSLLDEAEQIKFNDAWSLVKKPQPAVQEAEGRNIHIDKIKRLEEPISSRPLTKAEEILLLKASKLNGFKFPPWKVPPRESDFELRDGEALYLDTPELRLSDMQMAVFDDWKRPAEALPPPAWRANRSDITSADLTMTSDKAIDLVQDAATDCSVVASLCAGVARGERGHATILSAVMYPYDFETQRPKISENGKYTVRLNFNGTYRRVDIDDRLPVSKTARVLHVVDRRNPGLLWPALLEKAYLKVRGSYDFPGSNSGTDLWILSGWIPEQVFLQSDDTMPNQVWKRMHDAHKYGDVLVTMGTGKMSSRAEKATGLAGEHDYAVLDLREVDDQKLLLVKNPWCEGTSWIGSMPRNIRLIKSNDQQDQPEEVDGDDDVVQSSRDLLNSDDQLSPGTFWMDLNSVLQHFESIYLNWNPGLFKYRQDYHFSWDLMPLGDPHAGRGKYKSFSDHPQLRLTVRHGMSLWVLLSRHFRDSGLSPVGSETGSSVPDTQMHGYISLYAYDNNGTRVFLGDNAIMRGPYVDSPQTLLKLDGLIPGRGYTVVPVEQDIPPGTHTFTISAFASSAITIEQALSKYPHQRVISASWTQETAGGNAHSPCYSQNPQFSITLAQRSSLTLLLETPSEHLHVHVKLLLGRGQRVESVRSRDIVFDSKDYRRGCALAESRDLVDAGTYTIICSTFEQGQTGRFTLRVDSGAPTIVRQLPREDAGRLRTRISNAAFRGQQYKIAAPILPRRSSKMRVLVKHMSTFPGSVASNAHQRHRPEHSMVRVTLEIGRGPERRILISSAGGEFSDSIAGVRTDEIDLSPKMAAGGHVWLVVERMSTPRDLPEEVFEVESFTETPDALDVGVWRKWDD